MAEDYGTIKDKKWDMIRFKAISRNIKQFTCMALISTHFFVAHANIISIFDLITRKFI